MLIVLVILLIVTNAVWAYTLLDRGVTLDHESTELVRQKRITDLLSALLLELPRGVGIEQAAATIRAKHPDLIVKRDGERLEAGDVVLEFQGDTLVRVAPL
ncbi:MAG: hypothetical protein IRY91_01695 [Gemmatimonadaceae bacterium]|nr:hypothetical protein [Gemmatimonadaceae bacterium]